MGSMPLPGTSSLDLPRKRSPPAVDYNPSLNKYGRAHCPCQVSATRGPATGHLIFLLCNLEALAIPPTVIPECLPFGSRATLCWGPDLPWRRSGSPGGWVCSLCNGTGSLWYKEKVAVSAQAPGKLGGFVVLLPVQLDALFARSVSSACSAPLSPCLPDFKTSNMSSRKPS